MKRIVLVLFSILLLSSCVTQKKYAELDDKYIKARSENEELKTKLNKLENASVKCQSELDLMKIDYEGMKKNYDNLKKLYDVKDATFKKMQSSYDALSRNSKQTLAFEAEKNKKLLKKLEKKEADLIKEEQRLEKMKTELAKRGQKISQMEALMAEKDQSLNDLKNSLSTALNSFIGQGLKVEQKNGKVYVSMENKLLFPSGSWRVKQNGRNAIKTIANVLSINPDIEIMIEGHTDNVPYHTKGALADNWDLSVKRATSVVRQLLKNKHIDPTRLIAAGRSKYHPIDDNKTSQGRAKNRRIEVILTPNLDKIMNLLKSE